MVERAPLLAIILCETNSFVSAIVNSSGEWTIGQTSKEDGEGSRMLAGLPSLFQHSRMFGFFVISEWHFANHMYHSPDGVTWSSIKLPAANPKVADSGCCSAASLRALCLVESGTVLVSYSESEEFYGGVWSSSIDKTFPANVTWTQLPELPESAQCSDKGSSSFIPASLREKTDDGAIFDVSTDWAVRIPGPTK